MRKRFVLHPYLAGLFPSLFLFAQNARQMHVTETLLPAVVVIAVVFLATTGLNLVLKNINKSGLIVTIFLVPFFSYGHLLNFARWTGLEYHRARPVDSGRRPPRCRFSRCPKPRHPAQTDFAS